MTFEPRVPLVTAERHVDYQTILDHILTRRDVVERNAAPVARRIAYMTVDQPQLHPVALVDELAARLERTLMQTARFGHRQTLTELKSLRTPRPRSVTAAYHVPDAGLHGQIAKGGLAAIQQLVRRRAAATAKAVAEAAAHASSTDASPAVRIAAGAAAAVAMLHNQVLELVGETLNLGRAAAALNGEQPPTYAMRSEQLDANTCEECDQLHGEIVEVGSDDYFALMPPAECLGGGRCRGIYVYGDEPDQVTLELAA